MKTLNECIKEKFIQNISESANPNSIIKDLSVSHLVDAHYDLTKGVHVDNAKLERADEIVDTLNKIKPNLGHGAETHNKDVRELGVTAYLHDKWVSWRHQHGIHPPKLEKKYGPTPEAKKPTFIQRVVDAWKK